MNTLPNFKGKRIAVIGDVCLDVYTEGTVERISPEAPVPVLNLKKRYIRPGMAANVAANVAALGGDALLVSVAGTDNEAIELRLALGALGVDTSRVFNSHERPTSRKERVLTVQQQIVRVDHEVKTPLTEDEAKQLYLAMSTLKNIDAVIVQDHAKGVVSARLIDEARLCLAPIFVDPNINQRPGVYQDTTFLTPNKAEAERLTGVTISDSDSLRHALRELSSIARHPVITMGAQGVAWLDGNKVMISPAKAKEVYDVSGAGDTVVASLALSIAAGATLADAVEIANIAAGVVVGKRGTATATVDELTAYMETLS